MSSTFLTPFRSHFHILLIILQSFSYWVRDGKWKRKSFLWLWELIDAWLSGLVSAGIRFSLFQVKWSFSQNKILFIWSKMKTRKKIVWDFLGGCTTRSSVLLQVKARTIYIIIKIIYCIFFMTNATLHTNLLHSFYTSWCNMFYVIFFKKSN